MNTISSGEYLTILLNLEWPSLSFASNLLENNWLVGLYSIIIKWDNGSSTKFAESKLLWAYYIILLKDYQYGKLRDAYQKEKGWIPES